MPTYDYACGACGHSFEVFEKPPEGGSKSCPKCGRRKARRQISSGAGFIFKGSGFYATDYKKAPTTTSSEPVKKKTVRKETKTDKEKKA